MEKKFLGKLYFNNVPIGSSQSSFSKFTYADILNKLIGYKLEERSADGDEIRFKITDGKFTTSSTFQVKRSSTSKGVVVPYLEKNEGLQAIAGKISIDISIDFYT